MEQTAKLTGQPRIRAATPEDAAGINAVYNPFIRERAATFEMDEYDDADRRHWLARIDENPNCAAMVATGSSGEVLGFANASPFDPREGYDSSVKVSVFLGPKGQGIGLGRRLYEALFEAISGAGLHRAYALIVAPNPASVALHEAFGFAHVATLSEVGRKFGRFHDVMWFEKRL